MSGPHGPDPTQPWGGQSQDPSAQGNDAGQPNPWGQQPAPNEPTAMAPTWGQEPPAYGQQPQYPSYPGSDSGYSSSAPTSYSSTPQYGTPTGDYGTPGAQYGSSYPGTDQYSQQGQYGQYGQPPGQPGQPGQYGPGQFGQGEPQKSGSGKAIVAVLGVLAVVIIAAVAVTGFWKPGFFVTTQLDINKAQEGVQAILEDETNGYGAKNVSDVVCNDGNNPEVKKGDTFTCQVSIDNTHREVTVTFLDDEGKYEVGRPK